MIIDVGIIIIAGGDVIVVVDDENDVVEDGEKPEKLALGSVFFNKLTGLLEHIGHCPYSL